MFGSALSRKVTSFVAQSGQGNPPEKLVIRDLSARTDWSAATDFVRAFHLSLQADMPQDYVLASGTVHCVKDLVETAFGTLNLDWRDFVDVDVQNRNKLEPCLQGNPQRAKEVLGWQCEETFESLIQEMVKFDCAQR